MSSPTSLSAVFCIGLGISSIGFCLSQSGPMVASDEIALGPSTIHKISAFELPAVGGGKLTLSGEANATVVCFLGTECPLARQYAPRLQKLQDQLKDQGVDFVGVISNVQDSLTDVERFCEANEIRFPVGIDTDQKVAQMFGAQRTPEVFVLDRQRSIRYQGRIDDQFMPGVKKPKPSENDLAEALNDLLNGRSVRVLRTQAVGCLIGKAHRQPSTSMVTYTSHIARVFNDHCVECHRPGEIGPFSMSSYEELRGWGEMIQEVIDQGRMPPWHAAPGHAPLLNARAMPESDKQLVRQWVAGGMPLGADRDLPVTAGSPTTADSPLTGEAKPEWRLSRAPDLVVAMRGRPYRVAGEGTVDYQYFVVDPKIEEERWVSAAQVIPGAPAVVHHAIVFIRPPDGADFRGVNWLTAYVPGQRNFDLPPGTARRVPAGSKFVFQMHYTPNGRAQEDVTRLGILFEDANHVQNEVVTHLAINQEFEIPANDADYPVSAKVQQLPRDGTLLAVSPHMHVRGKCFRLFAQPSGHAPEILLDVPRYDFNWQHTYVFRDPLPLRAIDSLEFTAKFDNSTGNPVNPNPNTTVSWGDQTWEEMAVAFFEISQPVNLPTEKETAAESRSASAGGAVGTDKAAAAPNGVMEASEQFADDFLEKLDRNRDGHVDFDEAPLSIQRYSFWRFDADRNEKIDRDELIKIAPRVRSR